MYTERIEMVRAMETIARSLNDERHIDFWLELGVPDGAIQPDTTDEELIWMVEDDDTFADLMDTFVCLMSAACKPRPDDRAGTLYCDGILSGSANM